MKKVTDYRHNSMLNDIPMSQLSSARSVQISPSHMLFQGKSALNSIDKLS